MNDARRREGSVTGKKQFGLPTGPIGLVNVCKIPDGLDEEQTERFLRESGPGMWGR